MLERNSYVDAGWNAALGESTDEFLSDHGQALLDPPSPSFLYS